MNLNSFLARDLGLNLLSVLFFQNWHSPENFKNLVETSLRITIFGLFHNEIIIGQSNNQTIMKALLQNHSVWFRCQRISYEYRNKRWNISQSWLSFLLYLRITNHFEISDGHWYHTFQNCRFHNSILLLLGWFLTSKVLLVSSSCSGLSFKAIPGLPIDMYFFLNVVC